MSVLLALVNHLATAVPVSALVGDRVYADQVSQEESQFPRIVLKSDDFGDNTYHSLGESGLQLVEVDALCQASNIEGAFALYAAMRPTVSGFTGSMGTIEVDSIFISPPAIRTTPPVHGEEEGIPTVVGRMRVWHYA